MTLRIYNTLTRTKEVFTPIDAKNVRMYVCGPTVYDFAHIGNARPAIVFDVLYRLLRHIYGKQHVTYVRNITDVDDKINARALRDYPDTPLNDAIRKVTEKTYDQYQKDVEALGCLPPTAQPRATEHIAGIIKMIQVLLDRKYAYVIQGEEGREALFDVKMMKDYGALSGRKLDEQQAGARVAVEKHKRNPGDFVLWKESKASEPGWDATFELSPENQNELKLNSRSVMIFGRPGWHIECSVMSKAHLGEVFDIHGGGLDLIFPHHENEIAQSRCAHGTDVMANYWMHNGFLQVEGQKMSKSVGNFITISELLDTEKFGGRMWPGETLRLAMLRTHYRQPVDWTVRSLEEANAQLRIWHRFVRDRFWPPAIEPDQEMVATLSDDLNSHQALMRLNELFNAAKNDEVGYAVFVSSAQLMGFLIDRHFNAEGNEVSFDPAAVNSLITARVEARKAKDWKRSDEIRDELAAMGVQIQDVKDPVTGEFKTEWEVKR